MKVLIALALPLAFTGKTSDITNMGIWPHPRENATMYMTKLQTGSHVMLLAAPAVKLW